MYYFDNAATTYPKPDSVVRSLGLAAVRYGGNPGRSGHALSARTAEMVYRVREKAADFFGAVPENVVFTCNCTHALNMAIKGAIPPDGHAVISALEHNSVVRPLYALGKTAGVAWTVVEPRETDEETVAAFARALTPRTAAVVCTHASNLTGRILPVEGLADLCRERGILLIVDAAQSAGLLPINLRRFGRSVVCAAGHKGLYGASGTGLMLLGEDVRLSTVLEGGTGSVSDDPEQPDFLPDRFESGTVNTVGIFSLGRGIDFVRRRGAARILRHETAVCAAVADALKRRPGVRLLDPSFGEGTHLPVLSFTHEAIDSGEIGARFDRAGIAVRCGLHCAPLAHRFYGSRETGAVRISPGAFTEEREVEALVKEINKL